MDKKFKNVKCDCGHLPEKHFKGTGCCHGQVEYRGISLVCGCTWYHPNVRYIKNKKKKRMGDITCPTCFGTKRHNGHACESCVKKK